MLSTEDDQKKVCRRRKSEEESMKKPAIGPRTLELLTQMATDGSEIERQAYGVVKKVHDERPGLADQILWAAAKHIAREIVLEQRGQFQDLNKPKQKN
jgi:hypothetical protein